MKMKLSDVLDNLAAGEFSLSSIVDEATGEIPLAKVNSRLIPVINAGLAEIYSQFFLKRKEIWLQICAGKSRYVLDRKSAKSAHRLRGNASIDDCEDPFFDDIIEILGVFNEHGHRFNLNVDGMQSSAKPRGCNHGHGKCGCGTLDTPGTIVTRHSPFGCAPHHQQTHYVPGVVFHTPAYNVLRVDGHLNDQWVKVEYKASPRRLSKIDDDGLYDPEDINIDLPYDYLNALIFYIASRLTNANMNGVQQGFHEGNNYYQRFVSACAMLVDRGHDVENINASSTRFERSGFI